MLAPLARIVVPALAAVLATLPVTSVTATEPPVPHTSGHATKKGGSGDDRARPELVATLVQTHTDERVMLDKVGPSPGRFAALLSDRVTGASLALDPRLLDLIRALAAQHATSGAARVELVSGFRSPKLNEMMRKKGHHVASHSQHSLGHAVDFRIVPGGAVKGVDPRTLELEIRALGWDGGVGIYTLKHDWFVHVDVGPKRRWSGL